MSQAFSSGAGDSRGGVDGNRGESHRRRNSSQSEYLAKALPLSVLAVVMGQVYHQALPSPGAPRRVYIIFIRETTKEKGVDTCRAF